jgi:hypothetical protein
MNVLSDIGFLDSPFCTGADCRYPVQVNFFSSDVLPIYGFAVCQALGLVNAGRPMAG